MPATVINLYQAKTSLSQLVERAAAGEEIVIAKAGKPKARLVPLAGRAGPRQPGGWEGKVSIAEDFDEPLPDDILAGFESKEGSLPPSCSSPRTPSSGGARTAHVWARTPARASYRRARSSSASRAPGKRRSRSRSAS